MRSSKSPASLAIVALLFIGAACPCVEPVVDAGASPDGEGEGEGESTDEGVEGEPCNADEPCATGHFCYERLCALLCTEPCGERACIELDEAGLEGGGICARAEEGGPCAREEGCGPELVCETAGVAPVVAGICRPAAERGVTCASADDGGSSYRRDCAAGLACVPVPDDGGGKSVHRTCDVACVVDADCAETDSCLLERCVIDICRAGCPADAASCRTAASCQRACAAPAGEGEVCREGVDDAECGLFDECTCAVTITCEGGLACVDVVTNDAARCMSLTCSPGDDTCGGDVCALAACVTTCGPPADDGEPCWSFVGDACAGVARACGEGFECFAGEAPALDDTVLVCATPRGAGEACAPELPLVNELGFATDDGCAAGLVCGNATATCIEGA